jgi:hypothetical protein
MTPREAAIVTAYTGIFLGDFGAFQEYVEEILGRPVWSHEFASEKLEIEIRERSRADFMAIKVE